MPSYQNSPILGPFITFWLTKRSACTALSIVQVLKMLDIIKNIVMMELIYRFSFEKSKGIQIAPRVAKMLPKLLISGDWVLAVKSFYRDFEVPELFA